ncbi:MAG: SsrA-binding protein SmpB [Desulfuromonadaceae bacterium]|nr:SsrA-binding protein SmpB [Desulfuromonadaceae bacterium]
MGIKIIANNKKAYHDYFIEDTWEAGLVLTGTEIKSIRDGKVSLKESFCRIRNGEAFIDNMNISVYEQGNRFNHDPTRSRKLLLHRLEIEKISKRVDERGYTLIATKLYLKGGRAKVEVGVGKGKHLYDKRETLKRQQATRESERAIREHRDG